MADKESINRIITEIFALNDPKIEESRRENIISFVETTINGDSVDATLAINARLSKDVKGALVYVLTNHRLIKFDIDHDDIKSNTYPINPIPAVERALESGGASVRINFQNGGSIGLRYDSSKTQITNFFQKIDQPRAKDMP